MIDPKKWYTISELLKAGQDGYLPTKSRSLYMNAMKKGKLSFVQAGTSWRKVLGSDVISFFNKQKSKKL